MKMTNVFKKLLFCVAMANAGLVLGQISEEPRTPDGRAFSTLSNQELEKLSKRDQDAYEAWLDAEIARRKTEAKEREIRIAEMDAEAKEREIRIAEMDAKLKELKEKVAQSGLIKNILKHNAEEPHNLVKRKELQQQLSQMPSLLTDPILVNFSRDYLAGKPMNAAHILAIQRWNIELKVP